VSGVYSLKITFTATVLLVLCLVILAQFIALCSGSGRFQEVGGDFGRAWIGNFQAQNPKPADQTNNSTLWGWGTLPKGKVLIGGKIVDAPNSTWLYNATDWMGDNYVDPYSGYYIDPLTGQPVYRNFLVFPNNGYQQPNYGNEPNLPEILRSLTTNL
jgi:hypothetical protein